MAPQKLREAIAELEQQKAHIDAALLRLREGLSILEHDGNHPPALNGASRQREAIGGTVRQGSHFDNALRVLSKFPAPLHINDLQKYVEKMTGKPLTRASLEGAISRHIRVKGDQSLIVRVRPSEYAVRHLLPIPKADS